MSANCLFCKIIAGEIPSEFLYENKDLVAFRDISPMAPTHILIIPKKHYACLNEIPETELGICSELMKTARTLAKNEGIDEKGYRVVMNTNEEGGQTVFHVHLHLLGGTALSGKLA